MITPSILWKYRKYDNNARQLLTNGELFFASTDKLEDQNEKACFEFTRSVWGYDKKGIVKLLSPEERRQQFLRVLRSGKSETYGVLSLCDSSSEDLMWQQYADNGQGICIGFEWDKIELNHFGSFPPEKNKPSKVIYDDNSIRITEKYCSLEQWLTIFNTKLSKYSFEKEWRFFYQQGKFEHPSVRQAIREIIFGYNTLDNHILEIMNLVKDLPRIKFFKAIRLENMILVQELDIQVYTSDIACELG